MSSFVYQIALILSLSKYLSSTWALGIDQNTQQPALILMELVIYFAYNYVQFLSFVPLTPQLQAWE